MRVSPRLHAPLPSRVATATSPGAAVEELFRPSGERPAQIQWQAPIEDIDRPPGSTSPYRYLPTTPVLGPDGSLYVGTHRGELLAFGPDRKLAWKRPLEGASADNEPTFGWDGSLLLTNEKDARLLKLRPDGTEVYDTTLPEPAHTRPVTELDGRVYLSGAQALHCVEPDGSMAWSHDLRSDFCSFSVRPDGTVLQMHVSKHFGEPTEFDLLDRDGRVKWSGVSEGRLRGAPATGPQGEIILAEDKQLRILDDSGHTVRRIPLNGHPRQPLVTPSGRILVGTEGGQLHAFGMKGRSLWTADLGSPVAESLVRRRDGSVLVITGNGILTAVSSRGKRLWAFDPKSDSRIHVTSAPDGSVFVQADYSRVELLGDRGEHQGTFRSHSVSMGEGLASGAVPVCDFHNVYELAPGSLVQPPAEDSSPAGGTIQRVGDWVIVGGVAVPVRKPRL